MRPHWSSSGQRLFVHPSPFGSAPLVSTTPLRTPSLASCVRPSHPSIERHPTHPHPTRSSSSREWRESACVRPPTREATGRSRGHRSVARAAQASSAAGVGRAAKACAESSGPETRTGSPTTLLPPPPALLRGDGVRRWRVFTRLQPSSQPRSSHPCTQVRRRPSDQHQARALRFEPPPPPPDAAHYNTHPTRRPA